MAGRPTKYNDDVAKKICDAIRVGATFRLAAAFAGISEDTFQRWHKNNAVFADAIKEAEGAGAVGWLAKIEKAANEGAWQAAAWKLERRYPKEYGRTVVSQEHTGEINVRSVINSLPEPARQAVVALLAADPDSD